MTQTAGRAAPDPYRVLFPVGWALGIWGAAVWILGFLDLTSGYAGTMHADLMIGGFLFAFVCGFLMTAIPRFTATAHATWTEIAVATSLLTALAASALAQSLSGVHACETVGVLALFVFAAGRFRSRADNPPPTFLFIPVGLLCGATGAALTLMTDRALLDPSWLLPARSLYTQGMVLGMVLGVGGRLIPALTGYAPLPNPGLPTHVTIPAYVAELPSSLLASALGLLLSFPLEAAVHLAAGRWLRAFVVAFVAWRFWGILRYPKTQTRLALWLWVSAWMTVLGFVGFATSPVHSIGLLHLAFVGGFGLMTPLVATRVTVAHGGFATARWEDSLVLTATALLILLAAFTRASVTFVPSTYQTHIFYAAVFWITALLVWGAAFLGKMVRVAATPRGDA